MTTKVKIIAGFTAMVLLISIIAVIGYRSAVGSADGFVEYRRLARFNVAASEIGLTLYKATGSVNDFLVRKDSEAIKTAKAAVDGALEQINVTIDLSRREDTKASMAALGAEIQKIHPLIVSVDNSVADAAEFYTGTLLSAAAQLQNGFAQFTQASARAQDVPGLVLITEALNRFAVVRASAARYSVTRMDNDAAAVRNNLTEMRQSIEAIQANVVSERGQQLMRALMDSFDTYARSFDELVKKGNDLNGVLASIGKVSKVGVDAAVEMSVERDRRMRSFGDEMAATAASVKSEMLLIGGLGFLLGIGIALFIVKGLSSVLHQLSVFATEVSAGNFKAPIAVTEGGDIGNMVKALQRIPTVISEVMDGAKMLSHDILVGKFRSRMDSEKYSGGFTELARTVNTVADSYTDVLDMMPIPIKTGDTNKLIRFLNKEAQKVMGGNFVDQKCAEYIKSGVCGTDNCFGEQCMKRNGVHGGETIAKPQDSRMDLAVTAIPLKNERGQTAAFIEIINNVSEIKEKQNVIVRVANQASEIADRVAAASEEIAAQVEQISRGAEIQRERVESTASAMTQMNSTVLEVARNSGEAADQSSTTKEKAEHGAGLVREVVSSIATVNTVTQNMQKDMSDLGQLAENVGGVMNVISDVADQTNLLALNAAIEAARAGEAGRGFAVVADEVRKLAEKSMQATQEVGSNIAAIQEAVRKNILSMGDAAKGVTDATGLANSSGDALSEIVNLASDSSAVVSSIATAAEEQSATSEEISHAIDEINRIVGETTEGMVQSAQAVQELSRMTQELRSIIDSLR